jgi:F-type H+-transporting ATPase subunit epsilon
MAEQELTMRLRVMTPDRVVLDQAVTSLRFEEMDGWRGILPHHAPYLTRLVRGALLYRVHEEEEPRYLALFGGTLEVQEDGVLVLTGAAEPESSLTELVRHVQERQAEADALAFEAHIEFVKVRAALIQATVGAPPTPEPVR